MKATTYELIRQTAIQFMLQHGKHLPQLILANKKEVSAMTFALSNVEETIKKYMGDAVRMGYDKVTLICEFKCRHFPPPTKLLGVCEFTKQGTKTSLTIFRNNAAFDMGEAPELEGLNPYVGTKA